MAEYHHAPGGAGLGGPPGYETLDVANLAALRAVSTVALTTPNLYAVADGPTAGPEPDVYRFVPGDTTTAELLPNVVVATDGGRFFLVDTAEQWPQDLYVSHRY